MKNLYKIAKKRQKVDLDMQQLDKTQLEGYIWFSKSSIKAYHFSLDNQVYTDELFSMIKEIFLNLKEHPKTIHIMDSLSTAAQVQMLWVAIKRFTKLESLNVQRNCIGVEGMRTLKENLVGYYRLTSLNLEGNLLSVEGIKYLCEAFPMLKRLFALNLADNNITAEGAKYLSEAIPSLQALELLNLKNNELGIEGISYICNTVYQLPHLAYLNLGMNNMYDEGILIIASIINSMKNLSFLYVDCLIGQSAIDELVSQAQPYLKIISIGEENVRKVIKQRSLPSLIFQV